VALEAARRSHSGVGVLPLWGTIAGGAVAAILGVALAVWPTLTVAAAIIAAVVVLAIRYPEYAFLVSVVLFACEGSLKAMLAVEGIPLGASTNAVGAALVDTCLAVSFLGLLRHEPRARFKRVWDSLPRAGRLALGLIAGWIVISAVQAVSIGSLSEGIHGFRLVQAYVIAGMVGAILLARLPRSGLIPLLLAGLLVVAGYAVFRVVVGPSAVEESYAVSREGVITYGGVIRAAGSFSAAAGLASYLVPAAAFAFIVAVTLPRYRVLATVVFACALIAIIASYVRSGVVALALGLLIGSGLLLAQSGWDRRRRLALVGAVAAAFFALGLGTVIASRVSADVTTRARGFVDPLADESVQQRFTTWQSTLTEIRRHPLGTGVGSVGRASAYSGDEIVPVDNSYLLLLREQGWLGGPLFIVGVVTLLVALALASLERSRAFHPLTVAALAGASSFLALGAAGEYIEQPGKILAWLFLGIAVLEIACVRQEETAARA